MAYNNAILPDRRDRADLEVVRDKGYNYGRYGFFEGAEYGMLDRSHRFECGR